jgi:hypothetical protein
MGFVICGAPHWSLFPLLFRLSQRSSVLSERRGEKPSWQKNNKQPLLTTTREHAVFAGEGATPHVVMVPI